MGPRNTRRLVAAAVALVVVGAVVRFLVRQPSNPGGSAARASHAKSTGPPLVFGSTPAQVRRITGAPTTIRGNCWLFRPHDGMVGSIRITRTFPMRVPPQALFKLCFVGGLLSTAERQEPAGDVTVSPFPGGKSKAPRPKGAWSWTLWLQNPCGKPC